MSDAITSILTDASTRGQANVEQKLFAGGATTYGAWFN
jgi:hypothetical protein